MNTSEWADKNYYADLGVSSSASHDDIKRAYRKLARDNHPDKNPGDKKAEERFKRAAEAYDVVGDETKRKEYDQLKAMLASGGPRGFRSSQNINVEDLFGGGFSQDGSLGDIFGGLFNRGGRAPQPSRGADVEADITLDFREAAKGTTIPLQLTGDAPCGSCHGSGSASGHPTRCPKCNGTGFLSESRGAFGFSQPCDECHGTGSVVTDPCIDCQGTGTVHKQRNIRVRIPAGVVDGQKVRLAGQGEAGPNGKPSGDLFVTVHVTPDKIFTREGNDLHVTVPVSFTELALGGTITVPTLGQPVRVKVPAGTPNGRTLRVRGRGVEKGSSKGDLLVTVDVKVPTTLDANATSALRAYAQAEKDSGFDPRAGWNGSE
ncbi:molecular chaperone DnaJ [Corynebacterium sp. 13CS0277]|uniref:molecular chaperone DnaJ n=1 Tax=Corynebacterium sp. 13CS0277 TaxID=2071994 RepID=UPI000D03F694|nr:molecular chaperone DnaJ [Corynebacterium sp. 13CS0277]PRQ11819.1 molecular chaperone DnaJ [Corynebacterium sp. 13CS0277]